MRTSLSGKMAQPNLAGRLETALAISPGLRIDIGTERGARIRRLRLLVSLFLITIRGTEPHGERAVPRIHPTAIISPERDLAEDVQSVLYVVIEGGCVWAGAASCGRMLCSAAPLTMGQRNQVYAVPSSANAAAS